MITSNARSEAAIRPPARTFSVVLAAGWIALSAAAWAYAQSRRVPVSVAVPLALAFLTEFSFYLLLGFAEARKYLARLFGRVQIATGILISALLPYLICCVFARPFNPLAAFTWLLIDAVVAFWFLRPVSPKVLAGGRDLAFLVLLALVILSGVLRWIFPAPLPKIPLEVLGHITLVRSSILAILLLRGCRETGIGFIPRGRDLAIGGLWFLVCSAVALPLGLKLGQLHISGRVPGLWPSVGLLLGVFWVLALSEEFFFRGLLQQWLSEWIGSRAAALVFSAMLFALCHLGFRGAFPNWRVAALAFILGLSCGAAFLQARSIRASMVTHALAVGAWRLLLS